MYIVDLANPSNVHADFISMTRIRLEQIHFVCSRPAGGRGTADICLHDLDKGEELTKLEKVAKFNLQK
jgi:hypothetical protein